MKFGTLDENTDTHLLYDNTTTSYPVNLPTEFYKKYMHEAMPAKGALKPGLSQDPADAKDDKWFVRPHHVESLTKHERSMKDDVTNTRYYSHVNQDHGKVPEVNWCEEAMGHIE